MNNKLISLTLLCVFSAIMALTTIYLFTIFGIAVGGLTPIATGIIASIFAIPLVIFGFNTGLAFSAFPYGVDRKKR